jgi:hypothetical protein
MGSTGENLENMERVNVPLQAVLEMGVGKPRGGRVSRLVNLFSGQGGQEQQQPEENQQRSEEAVEPEELNEGHFLQRPGLQG